MHILIAPNAFKNSITATAAATAIHEGLDQSRLKCSCSCFPIGDGGDGTGEILIQKLNGVQQEARVEDPVGRTISASYGIINGTTAIIEMANASGLRLLKKQEARPLRTSTFGTGQLILDALNKGAQKIILCIGGSATVDGGMGVLRALGARFIREDGKEILLTQELPQLKSIDLSLIDKRVNSCELLVLCDVDNPLLGQDGAAAVFGPQKGAGPDEIVVLESGLKQLATVAKQINGIDIGSLRHGGAAGGTAAGLHAFLGARLVPGLDEFLSMTRFENELEKANLLITGEGSLDEQSLHGKGPVGLARMAKEKSIPVIGIAGRVQQHPELQKYFIALFSIAPGPDSLDECMNRAEHLLKNTAMQLGNLLSISGSFR
ncbi:MAG: glycerate kinase [Flavisolibacter sp.]